MQRCKSLHARTASLAKPKSWVQGESQEQLLAEVTELRQRVAELETSEAERKRVEEALIAREARFRTMIEKNADGIIIVDGEGIVLFANPAAEVLFDRKEEELLRTLFGFPVSADATSEIEIVREGRKTARAEMHVVKTEWGDQPVYLATLRDITERKEAEETQRESEEELEAIFNDTRIAIAVFDKTGKILRVNRHLLEAGGYTEEDIVGKRLNLLTMFPPKSMARMLINFAKLITGKKVPPFEVEVYTKKGEQHTTELHGSLLRKNGKVVGMVGAMRDVTEHRRAEKTLQESEEKYRSLVERANDGITIIQDRMMKYINRRLAEIWGGTAWELIDTPFTDYIDPEELPKVVDHYNRRMKNEDVPPIYETVLRCKDGSKVYVELNAGTIPYQGKLADLVFVRDITERKQAEEKLKETLADLKRSNKELEQFAYVTSHDLQEPLRMVSSYTQLLERRYKDKLGADAQEFIAYAVDGANRMQRLIQDLLAYSRVGSRGKIPQPTDCNVVLGRVRANLKVAIEENKALVTNYELPIVMADTTQLVQVFQNLIGNAIKFCSEEPPRIHVSAEKNKKEWIFSVLDNGKGIDPQYHERIFVIFQRLQGKGEYPGTGIGLAICKRIIERHGGRIWVESKPGKGSTFYFTIPE
jgi:PAS domain S-box-containing protein